MMSTRLTTGYLLAMTVPSPTEPTPADPAPQPLQPDVPGRPPDPVDRDPVGDVVKHGHADVGLPEHSPELNEVATEQSAARLDTEDGLDRELADSFPSSDPPSGWSGPDHE